MTAQKSNQWILRLPYFEKNKTWSLIEFLCWSIVFISDFGKKEEEHRRYKICLEQLAKSPELLKSHSNKSAQKLALRCLESYENERKSFEVESFWKTKKTRNDEIDSNDTISDDNNQEDFDEPEMEMVALSHKRKREVLHSLNNQDLYSEFP
ncbi:14171_t:CDS:2 [Cetraspora pellucida]|uniref:14171_t:CDS:1 n=1 Tax=Cetraspora pellucida TaxID=1433469 RepID=A0ACA9MZR8_9GLOM|nr:14171_t:CDS:2 [Cetraspora pellucida]